MSWTTPGPWQANIRTVTAPETDDHPELRVTIHSGNPKVARANARLIAAAPDLLDALKVAREAIIVLGIDCNCRHSALDRVDAVIMKATGSAP